MRLRQAHQILIGSAIGLAVLFGVRSMFNYSTTHLATDLWVAAASLVIAVALGVYLRRVRAKWALEGRDR